MKKSILRFGALALMSLMSIGVFAFEAIDKKGTYAPNSDGTNTVTLTKANNANVDAGKVVYEKVKDSSGNEYTVTRIGASAFKNATGGAVTSVTSVASTVKAVENRAFEGVTSLVINLAQLNSIGEYAFQNVSFQSPGAVTSTTIVPLLLTASSIGKGAFAGSNLVAVKWPARAETSTIPQECFKGCASLQVFELGKLAEGTDYVATIGESAFESCTALGHFGWLNTYNSEYCLPMTLKTISKKAFYNCSNLGVGVKGTTDSKMLKFSDIVTPSIEYVGEEAFTQSGLSSDSFNDIFRNETEPVITFAPKAFYSATGLANITLPKNVKFERYSDNNKTDETFANCSNLTKVTFKGISGELSRGCFMNSIALTTLLDFNTTTITYIPVKAFMASGLTAITFPQTVTMIDESAFENCTGLYASGHLNLPETIKKINKKAFSGTTFTTLTLPASLSSATKEATIQEKAFANTSLTKINLKGSNASGANFTPADKIYCATDDVFYGLTYTNVTLQVPYGCYEKYADQSMSNGQYNNKTWHNFTTAATTQIVTPVAGYATGERFWVEGIQYEVLANANTRTVSESVHVATVQVVDGLYKLGNNAYNSGSTKLKEQAKDWNGHKILGTTITIPKFVTTLYDKEVKYTEVDNLFGKEAYYQVVGIAEINTAPLTKADGSKSDEAKQIEKVETVAVQAPNIPEIPAIFNKAKGFSGLKNFKTELEGSIKSLANDAFMDCTNLVSANIKGTSDFSLIGDDAFNGCTNLTSFIIPTATTTNTKIGARAFNKTSLTSINIPASVNKIGVDAFNFIWDATGEVEKGVKNIYVNWEGTSDPTPGKWDGTGTEPASWIYANDATGATAFGTIQRENLNDGIFVHRRNLHYPSGMSAYYTAHDLFKNAADLFNTVEGIKVNYANYYMTCSDDPWEVPSITLYDGVSQVSVARDTKAHVTYVRDFATTYWQCWFVPFEYKYTADSPAEFAYLQDTQVAANGDTKFEYKKVPVGTTIKANVPYLVKPKAIDDAEFKSEKLIATNTTKTVKVSDVSTQYTFTGIYEKKTETRNDNAHTGGDYDWWYGLNAEYGYFQKAGKGAFVSAYRFIMECANNNGPYVKVVVLDDEDATAIENVKANSLNAPMFDLMGRQITAPAKGQVYIQNGVKKLAK